MVWQSNFDWTFLKIQTHSVDSTQGFICATIWVCDCDAATTHWHWRTVAQMKSCVESTLWVWIFSIVLNICAFISFCPFLFIIYWFIFSFSFQRSFKGGFIIQDSFGNGGSLQSSIAQFVNGQPVHKLQIAQLNNTKPGKSSGLFRLWRSSLATVIMFLRTTCFYIWGNVILSFN